jgi:lysophospholipase L1-like esterase
MRDHFTGRMRRVAVALLAALGLVVVSASPAWAGGPAVISPDPYPAPAPAPAPGAFATYLALGDSVPFGFRPGQPETYGNAANFAGFPEFVAADLHLNLLNASCPGETTDSFISFTSPSHGCENHMGSPGGYRIEHPLHVTYDFPQQSQLDYAVLTLKRARNLELVTVQIGANDGFVCQAAPERCAGSAAFGNVADHVRRNLDTILHALRTDGGYAGPIVVVTYYAPDYTDRAGAGGWQTVDNGIARAARANRAIVADGFQTFRQTALDKGGGNSMTAGLLLPNDFHPSEVGHRMLAQAVEAVLKR